MQEGEEERREGREGGFVRRWGRGRGGRGFEHIHTQSSQCSLSTPSTSLPSHSPLLPHRLSPHLFLKRDHTLSLEWRLDQILLKKAVSFFLHLLTLPLSPHFTLNTPSSSSQPHTHSHTHTHTYITPLIVLMCTCSISTLTPTLPNSHPHTLPHPHTPPHSYTHIHVPTLPHTHTHTCTFPHCHTHTPHTPTPTPPHSHTHTERGCEGVHPAVQRSSAGH